MKAGLMVRGSKKEEEYTKSSWLSERTRQTVNIVFGVSTACSIPSIININLIMLISLLYSPSSSGSLVIPVSLFITALIHCTHSYITYKSFVFFLFIILVDSKPLGTL